MWAQDAAAMYRYADLSSIVAKVTAFHQPPAVTNPPALSAHREVVAQSAMPVGTVSSYVQEIMAAGAQLISAVPRALQALASPSGPNCQPAPPVSFANVDIPVSAGMSQAAVLGKFSVPRHWHTATSAPPPAVVLSPLCTAWSPELPHPAGAGQVGSCTRPRCHSALATGRVTTALAVTNSSAAETTAMQAFPPLPHSAVLRPGPSR